MSACDPLIQAERRFKAVGLNRSRWDLFPCRGPVVPCRTLTVVSATATTLSIRVGWTSRVGDEINIKSRQQRAMLAAGGVLFCLRKVALDLLPLRVVRIRFQQLLPVLGSALPLPPHPAEIGAVLIPRRIAK
jgi:hypothetical protein